MPKEITHFALAEHVSRVLPKASKFFQPVQTFPFVFLIGAVCPDSSFYYLAGPQKKMDVHFQYLFPGKIRLYTIIRQAKISNPKLYPYIQHPIEISTHDFIFI
ncbi:zinc dependent phospholipase C family protein [Desulfobacter curvatus]|uniref:zinc dependent phospholipase C family protein n=1 Tax=Desulfobacter curvatus TaxID=2290 RepID=UPI000382E6B4|nr:zinc dependent phospholipase C family protein [Desulfobacter curvatus]